MGLDYQSLDSATRASMVAEIERDVAADSLYISPRLTDQGVREWPDLLLSAAETGTDDWLARELSARGLL